MPRVAVNYQNTIIYKIVCKDISITDCYVGSTTNFTKRKYAHHHSCNNEKGKAYHYNVYSFMRANGGWENWDMIEIEKYPCNDLNEALKRERHWIETLKATLNIVKPLRSIQDYRKDNAEKLKEHKKQYDIEHAKQIQSYNKKHWKENCDELKAKYKEYYKKNADQIKAQKKKYRETNADKNKVYQREYRLKKKKQLEEKTQSAEI